MEIFTNREIAVLFWSCLAAAFVVSKTSIRKAAAGVFSALFSRHLTPVYVTTAIYIAATVSLLAFAGVWNFSHLKMTLVWAFFVAFVELFRMPASAGEFIKFRQLFFDQLKVLIIVEYLVGYTAYPLLLELVLFPTLTFLVIIQTVAEGKDDLRPAYNVLTAILAIIVLTYLWAAIRQIAANFDEFASLSTLADFALPAILTILFLPYLFGLSLYSIYQTVFSTLKVFIEDAEIRQYAQSVATMTFGANVKLLHRWRRDMVISKPASRDEVRAITRDVLRRRKNENTRRYYALGEGWDPYVAKDFLAELGVNTDEYHCMPETPDEWYASATIQEQGEKYIGNHFSYYVEGEEAVARMLKLNVSVFDLQDVDATIKKFLAFASLLTEKALSQPLSDALIESIKERCEYAETLAGYRASVRVEEYSKTVAGFEIRYSLNTPT